MRLFSYYLCCRFSHNFLIQKNFSATKKEPRALVRLFINKTHGGTRLVLLPSRSDTLHKPTIVLAFRQNLVYRKNLCLASLSPEIFVDERFF